MYPDLRMYNEDIDMDVHLKIHHKIQINKLLKKRAENWNIGRRFQIRWAIRKKNENRIKLNKFICWKNTKKLHKVEKLENWKKLKKLENRAK